MRSGDYSAEQAASRETSESVCAGAAHGGHRSRASQSKGDRRALQGLEDDADVLIQGEA